MAWDPMYAPAECMMKIISMPSWTSFWTLARMKATSVGKVLASEPEVPVLGRGITSVA